MAVTLVGYIKRYVGLSTDDKPAGKDVPAGSVFIELNTDKKFVFDGEGTEGTWYEVTVGW